MKSWKVEKVTLSSDTAICSSDEHCVLASPSKLDGWSSKSPDTKSKILDLSVTCCVSVAVIWVVTIAPASTVCANS